MTQRYGLLLICLTLAGCAQAALATPTAMPKQAFLTPYILPTATLTPESEENLLPVPSAEPLPSPTPFTHTVKKNEDMLGIALKYGIKLQDLTNANPGVNPNLLSIGTQLIVPLPGMPTPAPQSQPLEGLAESGVSLAPVSCTRSANGGAWCFTLAKNPSTGGVENVSAMIRVYDANETRSQLAVTGLNVVPAGDALPLVAYFSPPLPQSFGAAAELLTANSLPEGDERYPVVEIDSPKIEVLSGELSAEVQGEVRLPEGKTAARIWVLAQAFDETGHLVGVRRWESSSSLADGERRLFSLRVYSWGAPISNVRLSAEAQ